MFGQSNNKSLFGTSNTSSAFGQPNTSAFGVQSTQNTGPFGAMSGQQPQQSLFGSSLSTQPLFGSNMGSTQTSIFGSTPNTGATNAFGAQQTPSAFGGTSTSLFGGNQQNNSLFGGNRFGNTNAATPFGSTAMGPAVAAPNGTTIKFSPTAGTDTMMKNGVSTNINTRHQCITCMREYENKSLEELRLEDYTANRKGPQQGSGMFGNTGAVSSNSLFGTTNTPQNAFSSTTNTGLFGQNKPTFGTLAPTTTTNSGLFSTFGQNKPLFGSNTSFPSAQTPAPTTSIFGSVSASNPTLNNTFFSGSANNTATVKPLFGGTTTQPQQPLFGQTTPQNQNLGQKPLFGNQSTSVPQFGTNTSTLFNSNPTSNLFSSSQPSLFNTGATSTNNTLGAKPLFNLNNPTSMPLNSSIGGTGGVTSTSNLFGNTSSFGNTNSMFGSNPTNFNFGYGNTGSATVGFPSSNTFQTNASLQPMSSTTQGVNNDQLVTRFQTFPYGDSPQLQIDVTLPSNARIRTKFTTDPKTLNQYKISAKTIDNRPQRVVNNSAKINTMLFDGLEDDNFAENKSAKDIFVPRKNIKKLVFKPKNTSTTSDLTLSHNSPNNSSFVIETQQNSGLKFDDSTVANMTVNEFNRKDTTFVKPIDIFPKSRLTISPTENTNFNISTLSGELSQNEIEINESESYSPNVLKCGVILNRTDYYTIPPLDELDDYYDASTDTCVVPNFTVGRHDYGSVYWDGPLDLKGLNLDEIVHIRRKEVIVYPDEDVAPKVGEGLNRPAQITMDKVWPIDKSTHEVIKDCDRLRAMRYPEKVEASTIKIGATFKEYRPDSGSWVFAVKHFSKYGLIEDDDEDEDVIPMDNSSQTMAKQNLDKRQIIDNKTKLFSKDTENRDISHESVLKDLSSDDFLVKSLKTRDHTMNYLFDDEDDGDMFENGIKELDLSSHISTKYSEFDKMRSTLFDEYEEVVSKKTKTYPLLSNQKEIKGKIFSPIVPTIGRPVVSKKRELTFEADVFAAENKLICDISSVCLSSSPKISFFNGSRNFLLIKGSSVLICEPHYFNFNASVVDRFEEQFEENSEIKKSSDERIVPFIKTREFAKNRYNPSSLELLVEALYGPVTGTPYACHQQKIDRILVWLFSANKKLSIPKKSFSKIIHFLSTNELEFAVDEAIHQNNLRMASLLSLGNSINKDLIISQLDSWKRSKADLFIDYDLIKVYVLMSGLIEWTLSNETVVKVLEDLKWTQQLALILLYKTPPEIETNELGLNLLSASISSLTIIPEEVEYHLLASTTPWTALCRKPSMFTDLDVWFLHQSLRSFRAILDDSSGLSDFVHISVASQLPDIRWACFVATHITEDSIRQMIIKEIITRNGRLLKENNVLTEWLTTKLHIQSIHISEALAIESKSTFDYKSLALNLIDCRQWSEAHDILIEWVFPQMIVTEQNDEIEELIVKLKPHSQQISNWYSNGAHIYETYLKCIQQSNLEDIKGFNIHQLKCNTKLHVLCQSEMARKVNIIFSELSGGQFAYNTPIPDDYALNELKINAKNLIKSLC